MVDTSTMECFYHPAVVAVGTCKSCHRGICRECVSEVRDGIACTDRCERGADSLGRLTRQNDASMFILAGFLVASGVIFFGWQVYTWVRYDDYIPAILSLGVVELVVGAGLGWKYARDRGRDDESAKP